MNVFFEALQPPTEILIEFRQYLRYADVTVLGGTVDSSVSTYALTGARSTTRRGTTWSTRTRGRRTGP